MQENNRTGKEKPEDRIEQANLSLKVILQARVIPYIQMELSVDNKAK